MEIKGLAIQQLTEKIKKLQAESFNYGAPGFQMVNPALTTAIEERKKLIDSLHTSAASSAPSQFDDLLGDKTKKEKKFDIPGFSEASIEYSKKQYEEQQKADKEAWQDRINIWKTSIKQMDDAERQRLDNKKEIDRESARLDKEKADFEIMNQKRTYEATWSMTFALDNLAQMGIAKSKMNANAKKDILIAMSIGEAAASAVKGIGQVWQDNTTGNVWGNLALSIALGAEIIAGAWTQIDSIQSTHFAMGTRNAPGGWSMVGEHGPESMYVPRGASIYNANETRNQTNNSGHTFNISLNASGTVAETLHAEIRAGDPGVTKLVTLLTRQMVKA
jgi:hypothetical protein